MQSTTYYNNAETIEEHQTISRAGLNTADGGMRVRPTSASIKKKQFVVSQGLTKVYRGTTWLQPNQPRRSEFTFNHY